MVAVAKLSNLTSYRRDLEAIKPYLKNGRRRWRWSGDNALTNNTPNNCNEYCN